MGVPNWGVAQRMRNILRTDRKDNEAAANEAQQRCWLQGQAISRRREGAGDKGERGRERTGWREREGDIL